MSKGKITIEKGNSPNPVIPVLFIFSLIIIGAVIVVLNRPVNLPGYEISNFVGKAEVFSKTKNTWVPLERGTSLGLGDKIRTTTDSEIDLRSGDEIIVRLKANSELQGIRPDLFSKVTYLPLELKKGTLLGATDKSFKEKNGIFEVATPVVVAAVRGTLFEVNAGDSNQPSQVSVLRGRAEVRNRSFLNLSPAIVMVEDVHKVESINGTLSKPVKIDRDEWNEIKEAYELIQHSAAFEAKQIDLSKKAGSFFDFTFDHGTFFTEKFGYAGREFMEDAKDKSVYFEIEYDVFPIGSTVGMYIKTRDLDISKYKGLQFEVRKNPDQDTVPEAFRMEFKFKSQTQRATSPKVFKNEWQPYQILFRGSKPTPVTEVTLVFSHAQVGEYKKGLVQLRKFELLPLDPDEIKEREAAAIAAGETVTPDSAASSGTQQQAIPRKTVSQTAAQPAASQKPKSISWDTSEPPTKTTL